MPTVAEVRAVSKADMNSVSSVMKQWRQSKLMPVKRIEEEAPDEIQTEAKVLVTKIWSVAKDQAEVKLREAENRFIEERNEAEQLRSELSEACDGLQQQLEETTRSKEALELQQGAKDEEIALLKDKLKHVEEAERLASARNVELDKQVSLQANEILKLEKIITEKDNKIINLTETIDKNKTQQNEEKFKLVEEHNTHVSELEKRIVELLGKVNTAEAITNQAKEHIQDLKGLLDKQQLQNESLQQQLDNVTRSLQSAKKTDAKTPRSKGGTSIKKSSTQTESPKGDKDVEN